MATFKTTSKVQKDAKAGKFVRPPKFPKFTAWSFSLYRRYKGCPYQTALDKALGQKMQNEGMTRGIDMHKVAEDFVGRQGKYKAPKAKTPIELKLVEEHALVLRNDPTTEVECPKTFTRNWGSMTEWFGKDAWVRIKIDALRTLKARKTGPQVIEVTDWKGGRPNAYWDKEQAELYALAEFKASGVEEVRTKFAHTDSGDETDGIFKRTEAPSLQKQWDARVKRLLADERFDPTPGRQCDWCDHSKKKGGVCHAG